MRNWKTVLRLLEGGKATAKRLARPADDVAALDVSLDVAAPGVREHGGEVLHRQRVLAANVDSAEQRDQDAQLFRARSAAAHMTSYPPDVSGSSASSSFASTRSRVSKPSVNQA